ncbi:hypothetical protein Pmani_037879 [Petrolisthes manimaculis]|uniref:Uncharacterized protein n=1 Tax=Petrolisthes manimaculis TaxID=1843537 RepID=A0AAE1NHG4_9EUCA|nr:hypothetical protein Pmani_037879 [Petrolisthes manimaculis]
MEGVDAFIDETRGSHGRQTRRRIAGRPGSVSGLVTRGCIDRDCVRGGPTVLVPPVGGRASGCTQEATDP